MDVSPYTFQVINNKHPDYEQVVKTRIAAYASAKRIDPEDAPGMRDRFDEFSRIICLKHGDKVIASVRVSTFEDAQREMKNWEIPTCLNPDDPSWSHVLPCPEDTLMVMRVCVLPEYQKTGAASMLFQTLGYMSVELNKRYTVGCCTSKHIALYERIGAKIKPLAFETDATGGGTQHVFYIDAYRTLLAQDVSLAAWSLVWSPVWKNKATHAFLPSMSLSKKLGLYTLARVRPIIDRLR